MLPSGTHVCVQWPSLGFYHRARLQRLGEDLHSSGCRLTALETAAGEEVYPWHGETTGRVSTSRDASSERRSYTTETVFPDAEFEHIAPGKIDTAVKQALTALDPDVVATNSYSLPDARAALEWGRRHRRAVVLMNDSKKDDAPRRRWREWVKTRLLRGFDAALVAGTPQRAYHRDLGLPEEAIWTGYDVVDNAYFAHAEENGSPPTEFVPYFLGVGRMKALKNFHSLIEAHARYAARVEHPFSLVLVGDGPDRDRLASMARNEGKGIVHLPGFQPPDRLRYWYAEAEALVHPARKDTWGLVVNEAMAAGLPVLVSNAAGCAKDLVEDGANGYLFEPSDTSALADLLVQYHEQDQTDRIRMGRASRAIIDDWDLERFSRGFRSAANYALERSDRGLSLELRLLLATIRTLSRSTDSFHSADV